MSKVYVRKMERGELSKAQLDLLENIAVYIRDTMMNSNLTFAETLSALSAHSMDNLAFLCRYVPEEAIGEMFDGIEGAVREILKTQTETK
jgi:aminoglycoside phosphotransferase family enzyme